MSFVVRNAADQSVTGVRGPGWNLRRWRASLLEGQWPHRGTHSRSGEGRDGKDRGRAARLALAAFCKPPRYSRFLNASAPAPNRRIAKTTSATACGQSTPNPTPRRKIPRQISRK